MSQGTACHCPERRKAPGDRAWVVTQLYCNHSAFNGGRHTASDYSAIRCNGCGASWRTRAAYVVQLRVSA